MTDQDDPDERRTEGVRIIGAQEAAEAAGRPDVVRRRRGSEKRFGDRPDRPAPASDLPKITISTTEGDGTPERFGSAPVVRPARGGADESPQWAEDPEDLYGPTDDDGTRINVGHARILPAEDAAPDSGPGDAWADDDPFGDPAPFSETGPFGDPAPYADPAPYSDAAGDPDPFAPVGAAHDPDPYAPSDVYGDPDPFADPGEPEASSREDDSFILPHWTEPPTGQVPKVVIGDDAPEPESLATYGSQPRWRDEGERTAVTDFDDLAEDGPRLGALSGNAGGAPDDDFFSPAQYADEDELDESEDEDDIEGFSPVGDFADLDSPRGGPRPRRRPEQGAAERTDGTPPPGGGDRNLVTAVGVGVGLVVLALACFKLGALPTAILVTAVVTFAAFEYFTAVRTAGHNPATLLGLVSVAGLVFATYTSGMEAYPIVLGLTAISGLLWYLFVAPGERSVPNLGLTLLGVMWIGVLGSFATLFLGLGRQLQDASALLGDELSSNPGIGVLIAAAIAAVSHDVGAYFVGRFFGSTPLSAASPNKTQEGLIGGVLCSVVVTFVVVGVVGIAPIGDGKAEAFVFALLCALAAPLGDLSESFVKRDLRIKDMGSVLPGHGGVLDRFDALLFVLPTAYFVTVLFETWTLSGS
jgi:phosphatidate cytidylyltransferase